MATPLNDVTANKALAQLRVKLARQLEAVKATEATIALFETVIAQTSKK